MALKDVMVSELLTVYEDETMQRPALFFKEFPFHHIPVVNRDVHLVGMLSSTDLAQISSGFSLFKMQNRAQYDDAIFQSTLLKDVMSKQVFSMHPDQTITEAYQQFRQGTYRAIPIVDGNQVVGLVTPLDIIEALLNT